jgi:hypothetical protein
MDVRSTLIEAPAAVAEPDLPVDDVIDDLEAVKSQQAAASVTTHLDRITLTG